jgi:hypothetical protein
MTSAPARLAILFVALGFAVLAPATVGRTWDLVTPEEDARDRAAPHVPLAMPPAAPSSPTIRLVQPDISRSVTNPMTIELQFAAGPGAAIDMQSFNATYGWLGINITRRVLEHSEVTRNGLIARDIDLPPGDHRVTMSIADTAGRSASRTFSLSVAR